MGKILTFIGPLLLGVLLATALQAAISDPEQAPVRPHPGLNLAPEEVVGIVIHALANNDDPYPDAGIETTFKFASPQNRANTGPLERFASMVRGYPFGDMIDHRASEISEAVLVGDRAYLLVKLIALDGREVAYAFRLSQQSDGIYQGMWMTDAVWPVDEP